MRIQLQKVENCPVKPSPHYLPFSEQSIVNRIVITGKEEFRLVYQNRPRIYPSQETTCNPTNKATVLSPLNYMLVHAAIGFDHIRF